MISIYIYNPCVINRITSTKFRCCWRLLKNDGKFGRILGGRKRRRPKRRRIVQTRNRAPRNLSVDSEEPVQRLLQTDLQRHFRPQGNGWPPRPWNGHPQGDQGGRRSLSEIWAIRERGFYFFFPTSDYQSLFFTVNFIFFRTTSKLQR